MRLGICLRQAELWWQGQVSGPAGGCTAEKVHALWLGAHPQRPVGLSVPECCSITIPSTTRRTAEATLHHAAQELHQADGGGRRRHRIGLCAAALPQPGRVPGAGELRGARPGRAPGHPLLPPAGLPGRRGRGEPHVARSAGALLPVLVLAARAHPEQVCGSRGCLLRFWPPAGLLADDAK